jgi:hypothetical protein
MRVLDVKESIFGSGHNFPPRPVGEHWRSGEGWAKDSLLPEDSWIATRHLLVADSWHTNGKRRQSSEFGLAKETELGGPPRKGKVRASSLSVTDASSDLRDHRLRSELYLCGPS